MKKQRGSVDFCDFESTLSNQQPDTNDTLVKYLFMDPCEKTHGESV